VKEYAYGAEKGNIENVISWLNEQTSSGGLKLNIKSEDYILSTQNFGEFELFSLSDDSLTVRKLISKAGKRFGIKMIEGGYKEKARIIRRRKSDYAKVLKGDKVIGHLELESARFGKLKWEVKAEERR
jgi:translation initiation factor IF-1